MSASHDSPRLHALDALRAAMMLLGLVLHSAVSFGDTPIGAAWPYQDRQTSVAFDWVTFIIHLFRMPTFFVMAGFFAALLYYREGTAGFLAHRTRRLVFPLVVAWIAIYPITRGGFVFARAGGGIAGWSAAAASMQSKPYALASTMHLWFIYYLIIFCAAAVVIAPVLERSLPPTVRARMLGLFERLVPTWPGCFGLAAVMAVALVLMRQPSLETPYTFIPSLRVLAAYSVFFSVGWLIFLRRDIVQWFGTHPWRFLAAGLVAGIVYMMLMLQPSLYSPRIRHLAASAAGGAATWLLIYGITGLFVRYFESPRPLQRYLSDASYWMYLIHVPFVIWFTGLLAPLALPAAAGFAVVLAATLAVTVTSYHFLVRSTAIGAFLNGRRFARALPRAGAGRAGPART